MALSQWLPRFQRAYRALGVLEGREAWPRSTLDQFQLERVNRLWRHARAHVPYYRHLALQARLPDRFASLTEFQASVPVLPKQAVRERPRDFLSERAEGGHWTKTGGSTGTPMEAYWGDAAQSEMLLGRYRLLASWGLDIFDRCAFLWGHSASLKPGLAGQVARWRQRAEDWLRNRIRLSAYRLGRDDLRGYLDQIASFRPASLYGYGQALALLAQEAEAVGFSCDSLKLALLTGEPAFDHLVATIQKVFRVPAVVEYGSSECGYLAGEGPDRKLRVREDNALIETRPREDGRHDLILTVLTNPSFPLIRYDIGDITDAPIDRQPHGMAVLKNVSGRNNDLIVSRSGRQLHSARFDALFKYQAEGVRLFRVKQNRDGSLSAQLELEGREAAAEVPRLERKLRELVEGYPVSVEVVDRIPVTPAGKHRLIVSELAAPPQSEASSPAWAGVTTVTAAPNGAPAVDLAAELPSAKAAALRRLICGPGLGFLMEAHSGLSAKVVEEAGFGAIWGSGLSISASLGVRDSNEASWTQVLEVLEYMSDATRIPILVDGDTGYGNFNNVRRLIAKLEQRAIAGVCIEDKVFPKTNSFIRGSMQPLADVEEFSGKIKAGKDAQRSADFVLIARVEALIAGHGMKEALRRAEAYHRAGADAILIHSALRVADEVLAFKKEWADRSPVVIVPTKYYQTPTEVFREAGFAAVIWANHLLRASLAAMQRTAKQIHAEQNLHAVEGQVAALGEVFRLQGEAELEEAQIRYLPVKEAPKKPSGVRPALPPVPTNGSGMTQGGFGS